ncbi:hypothetical protein [Leptospira sp. GIMC2001]|uniref:hypothetical protein n=1 Tax=Leptospira sp. GIMC2001 TaxID=1513297 RepID=UPI00234B22F3|nr:hypothetical protein [Leptospira sp. GIMC2001]WCL47690.1 hypothetical protein O4O04_00095 [Leptospira sp. GIMC2001]
MKTILRKNNRFAKYLQLSFSFLVIFFLIDCMGGFVDKGGHSRVIRLTPSATIIRSSEYTKLTHSEGESSTLFLFGLFPVTNNLDIEYAMSQAVQKVPDGQSLIDIQYWHETHYYYPVGTVSVLKVQGMVVSLKRETEVIETDNRNKKTNTKADTKTKQR